MLTNYFKVGLRNLLRNKGYSAINITGLAVGIACAVFIMLYVQDELSYDRHHSNHDRIVRAESHFSFEGQEEYAAPTSIPLGPTLASEYEEVLDFVRFQPADKTLFKYGEKEIYIDRIFFADASVFSVFDHGFIKGSPDSALTEPNTMVITEKTAGIIFGEEDPIGKTVTTGSGTQLKITGVVDNVPLNSHLIFNVLYSMKTLEQLAGAERFNAAEPGNFWNVQLFTYLLLDRAESRGIILGRSGQFYKKYMAEIGDQIKGGFSLMLTPLADIHLKSKLFWDLPVGNIRFVYIFSLIAVFIVIIASINYMNLATARSAKRAKEVGIRKALGANRGLLVKQFLAESMIIAFISFLFALLLIELFFPVFNELAGKEYDFSIFLTPVLFLEILALVLVIGIVSGSYPSFYLSSFMPVNVLKGSIRSGSGGFRKTLVVFQFVISVFMIIVTLTVLQQFRYMKNKDLGFVRDNVIVAPLRGEGAMENISSLITELKKIPGVKAAASSSSSPGGEYSKVVFRVDGETGLREQALDWFFADYDYLDLMGMKIIEGRGFDRDMGADGKEAFIINQAAAKKLGWGNNPVGKRMQFGIGLDGKADRDGRVIGVVKDFHHASLHNEIGPIVVMLSEDHVRLVHIRLEGGGNEDVLSGIEKTWKEFVPSHPLDYTWLDDNLSEHYRVEQKLATIFSIFAGFCILISCLGLLGLSSFMAEQRTREIGIRKVLGASMADILSCMTGNFIKLVFLACIIACPLAYYAVQKWLESFSYRVEPEIRVFVFAGLISLLVALLTVGYQAVRSALTNPVEAIRCQ